MKLYNNALPENLGKRAEVKTEFDAHKVPENLRKLAEELKKIDVMHITPIEAMSRLYELRKLVEEKEEK